MIIGDVVTTYEPVFMSIVPAAAPSYQAITLAKLKQSKWIKRVGKFY